MCVCVCVCVCMCVALLPLVPPCRLALLTLPVPSPAQFSLLVQQEILDMMATAQSAQETAGCLGAQVTDEEAKQDPLGSRHQEERFSVGARSSLSGLHEQDSQATPTRTAANSSARLSSVAPLSPLDIMVTTGLQVCWCCVRERSVSEMRRWGRERAHWP